MIFWILYFIAILAAVFSFDIITGSIAAGMLAGAFVVVGAVLGGALYEHESKP